MMPRSLLLKPALALVPTLLLAGCGNAPAAPPPLSEAALAAVTDTAGAPRDQLARAVDDLFTQPGLGETRAVVVMANGKLAAERYGPGYSEDTRFVSWSMAKTVTGVLIGMLVADGLLSLDAPAPVEQWQRPGDPRAEITLRHLLQMRSGLRHVESGDPPYESSEVRMLFLDGRDDMAKWAEEQPLAEEPGAKFVYSSNTSVILADIAAAALTGVENADEMRAGNDGKPIFLTNAAGGVLGGISTGQPIVARFAVKPTSSILTPRRTVTAQGENADISTKGRHDPCVGIRAVPIGEAMVACAIADHYLRHRGQTGR